MRTSICVLSCALLCLSWQARAVTLVAERQPRATIIMPRDASPTVKLAASELNRYFEAIAGARLPVVADGDSVGGYPIHVGLTTAAFPWLPREPEGIAYHCDDTLLVILGGSDRATLYAVYRFLERELGCRWLAHGIEFMPTRDTLQVGPAAFVSAPAFDMRTFAGRSPQFNGWAMRVGLNGFLTAEAADTTGNAYYLPAEVPSCHAYSRIIPADTYFAEHPDWFPLLRGARQPVRLDNMQLCVTAPGLADEFARRVNGMFDRDPNLQVVSISPNDGYGWCECETCLALDRRLCGGRTTRQGLSGDKPFMGDRVFWFANQVAERVARVHPDKLLLVLAYVNYAEPPDTVRPAPNVVPWLCHYAPADYSRPIADPSSPPNAQFNALLGRWAEMAPHLLFYSYVSKSMWWRLPRPILHNFAADLRHLHDLGIHRYYCQSALNDWALDGPLYYVLAHLLWDPAADADALAEDWTRCMFGSAAPHMLRYYQAVERSVRKSGQCYSDNPPVHVPGLYDFADLDLALSHLQAAEKAADSDLARGHVKSVADVFQYGYHMIRCLEAAARFEREPTQQVRREVAEEGKLALGFCKVREAEDFLSRFRFAEDLGVIGQGFGPPVELGGRRCWNTDETGLGDNAAGWASLVIETSDTARPVLVEMDVWGKSASFGLVINTDGTGKGTSEGGVWKSVAPDKPLSGAEQWDTVTFRIPPEFMVQGRKTQRAGLGGADSQIWIANIRVKTASD